MDESIFDIDAVTQRLSSDPNCVISSTVDDATVIMITRGREWTDGDYRVILEMAYTDESGDKEYSILDECWVLHTDHLLDLLISYVEHGGDPLTLQPS